MKTIITVTCDARRPLADGTIPLVVKLTKNNKRKYLRTGITLKPNHWDFVKNKPKPNCPNREYIEAIITEKLKEYQQQVLEFQSIARDYSLTTLVEKVENPIKRITVEDYLKTIISNLINEKKIGNAEHYKALFNSLLQFSKLNIIFSDIDVAYLNRYETYLRSRGNKDNTISIKMRTLRATYNKAIKEKAVKKDYYPFDDYNVSKLKESTPKRSITKEDIQKIISLDVKTISKRPQSLLQFSKDLFLFSYLGCGINMIDIAYLKKSNIVSNRVVYKRHKTGKQISFLLQPYALEIIQRYQDPDRDYIFPILDDSIHPTPEQQFRRVKKITFVANKNLKKIGESINLSIPLTTYVARHSYATVLKRSGVNIAIISETLGHSDLKTTQIYLDSFENSQIDEAMKNLL
ncbi:site-specific integrase [Dysgonomonas sp. Marseille-P4361]|uniref:site-specific integrase n=1 Tax=Dysgonomonas sp. Marseille-P4361 TaxID=2161820 RepID=UPI000D5518D5|nr:site-specific integrase [Dysgonomonas sp. Marseille-P4361]